MTKIKLDYCYWVCDEYKCDTHFMTKEQVKVAKVIERFRYGYTLRIDGKDYSYRSLLNKSTRKHQHFMEFILQDIEEYNAWKKELERKHDK